MKWIALSALACAAGFMGPASAASAPTYFPAEFARETPCPSNWPAHAAILSASGITWYSQHLGAAGEPSLYAALTNLKDAEQIIRFTWVRTFDAPVIVRIELPESGGGRLVAKMFSGKGGYGWGVVARDLERTLGPQEIDRLRKLLADPALDPLPSPNCEPLGVDGAQWIIERVDATGYRFRARQSPSDDSVRTIGLALLDLTGWTFGKVY